MEGHEMTPRPARPQRENREDWAGPNPPLSSRSSSSPQIVLVLVIVLVLSLLPFYLRTRTVNSSSLPLTPSSPRPSHASQASRTRKRTITRTREKNAANKDRLLRERGECPAPFSHLPSGAPLAHSPPCGASLRPPLAFFFFPLPSSRTRPPRFRSPRSTRSTSRRLRRPSTSAPFR